MDEHDKTELLRPQPDVLQLWHDGAMVAELGLVPDLGWLLTANDPAYTTYRLTPRGCQNVTTRAVQARQPEGA